MHRAYFLMRKELKLSPGKLAAQVGHLTSKLVLNPKVSSSKEFLSWIQEGETKIVLQATKEEILSFELEMKKNNIDTSLLFDAGKTQVAPNTLTGLVCRPLSEKESYKYMKTYKLY